MENKRNPLRRQDLIWREVDGEVVIISHDNKTMQVLSDVGSRIWVLLDGEQDVDAIASIISGEYGEAMHVVGKDLIEYLESLRQLNLLEE
jgi:hypothetical protein